MEDFKKRELLNAMVETETNMEKLYGLYAARFRDDRDFWEEIKSEENQHAAILQTGELYLLFNVLPDEALLDKLEALKATNLSIRTVTQEYAQHMPSKEEAYNYAVQMEKSLSEAFFQELLKMKGAPEIIAVWQKFGAESVDHSERIRRLLSR